MKSHKTIYVLLAAVAAIWGAVGWQLLRPRRNVRPPVSARHEQVVPASEPDTLYADYPDPFLKGFAARANPSSVRPKSTASPSSKPRMRINAGHRGTVTVAGRQLYLLLVDGRPYEVYSGERFDGFVLQGVDADSVYLEYDGVRYGIKRTEP